MRKAAVAIAIFLAVVALFVTGWPSRHFGPPDLAKGLISEKDWTDTRPASVRLTAKLRLRFPPSTEVDAFKAALADEGFRPTPKFESCHYFDQPSKNYCAPPPGIDRRMEYYWGTFPCDEWVAVDWSGDGHNHIGQLTAGYGNACI